MNNSLSPFKRDVEKKVQHRVHMNYKRQLVCFGKEVAEGRSNHSLQLLMGCYQDDRAKLFLAVAGNTTGGDGRRSRLGG